jgi:hypothetical protein
LKAPETSKVLQGESVMAIGHQGGAMPFGIAKGIVRCIGIFEQQMRGLG